MTKKLLAVIIAVLTLVMVVSGYAEEEEDILQRYKTENGIIVELWQSGVYYEKMSITLTTGDEDSEVTLTISGHPERTEELERCLEYFGIHNAFNRADGRLNYLNILVELGLEEGNI